MISDLHALKHLSGAPFYPREFFDINKHLPYRISMLTNLIRRATTEVFIRKSRLSGREWRVLCMIGIKGPIQPAELAEWTGMDRATITRAADRLSIMGFIERNKDTHDGRKIMLCLTEKGALKCDEILPSMRERGQLFEAALTEEELITLYKLLNKIEQVAYGMLEEDEGMRRFKKLSDA